MSREEKKKKVIDVLNRAKSMELQAIHQYMHQHYHLDDKDYGELAANMKLIAIDEMRHAEALAERITELGGEPTSDLAGPVVKGQTVEEIYPFDAEQEDEAIDVYSGFLNICRENGDSISAKLFEMIIEHEQEHYNYFDSIDDHIKTLGSTYLSRIAGTPASTGPAKGFAFVNQAE
jgi:bacterioferritin